MNTRGGCVHAAIARASVRVERMRLFAMAAFFAAVHRMAGDVLSGQVHDCVHAVDMARQVAGAAVAGSHASSFAPEGASRA